MSAGESAYGVARKHRDKAARLERSAALWEKGAAGEVAVATALAALPADWVVLHDLAWPGRQRANLDHVVIGPGGVFVVDAKNWSGRIEVRDHVLTQNGRRREEAVSSVAAAAIAVHALVSPLDCDGVLCFVRNDEVIATPGNVTVCSTANLVGVLDLSPARARAGRGGSLCGCDPSWRGAPGCASTQGCGARTPFGQASFSAGGCCGGPAVAAGRRVHRRPAEGGRVGRSAVRGCDRAG